MDPVTTIALASAALKLIKQTVTDIKAAWDNGEISAEKQDEVRAEFESLRNQLGGEFTGSHWELSGR